MQILYQLDTQQRFDALELVAERHFALVETELDGDARAYALRLCRGVLAHLNEIDRRVEQASRNWRIARMSRVDRNVLRLATYELHYLDDIPVPVVINEAVEIGKTFGAQESAAFINGVLDRVAGLPREV